MLGCWADKPDDRPSFKELVDRIENLLSGRAGYIDLHIDKALAAAEELSTSVIEYSYIDPDRMFRIIQSLRTSQNKHTSDSSQPPSLQSTTPRASESSYTGLKPESGKTENSYYSNLQSQTRTTTPKPTESVQLTKNHKTSDMRYTRLQPSSLDQDREYTTAKKVDLLHSLNKLKMVHNLGSRQEQISSASLNKDEDFTASGYVETNKF